MCKTLKMKFTRLLFIFFTAAGLIIASCSLIKKPSEKNSVSFTVADKPGATIKGVVYSGGRTMQGVSVSDGDLITQTDENGNYWLNSTKRNRQVFVILPSGYEAEITEGIPHFWAICKQAANTVEQIDFELFRKEDEKHTVVVFTDCHLANTNTPIDYLQFREGFLNEIKTTFNRMDNVIGLNLGDFTYDRYWYDNSYALPEAKKELATLNFPVFSVPGNHDNDPYITGDFNAEESWRNVMGPTYYSMNIGKIHYLMLDNVIWINTGGSEGIVGQNNYVAGIDSFQFEWVKKNLELVDANTPVIVGFHIPLITYTGVNDGSYVKSNIVAEMSSLMTELRKFKNVHILTGHNHSNRNITIDYKQGDYERREHSTVAVSGSWWCTNQYTAPDRLTISPDGTPAGYKVFEINGTDIKWHFKVVGQPRERQFIAFDMNEVKKYWTTNSAAIKAFSLPDFTSRANDYSSIGDNEVLINIWAYEQDFWKINVKENNMDLPVDAVWLNCPLHSISYDIPCLAEGTTPRPSRLSRPAHHMYRVKTSSPVSTLEITVEDRFGNVFKNTMTRPKSLTAIIE